MILAAHQPDLLPWSGFWHKMDRADVFDLAIYDQFQDRGYQRRVRMRGTWASLVLYERPKKVPIWQVRLRREAPDLLIDAIVGRYRGAKHWDDRSDALIYAIDESRAEHLWQFNVALIVKVRDLLGITTPVAVGTQPQGAGVDGLLDLCRQYGADTYLSGTGGRAYMGENPEEVFTASRVALEWSLHQPVTGDSIVSILMDEDDPLEVIRRWTR